MTRVADLTPPTLVRELSRTDVVALTLNNVVGAGVFTMPAALAASAGSASLAVLLLTIALISMMALCLVEVASRFDRTGGPMIYAADAFGPGAGFVVGWLMYLSRLSAFGAITVVLLDYGGGLWPPLGTPAARVAVMSGIVAALAAINIRGVVLGARISSVLAVLKVVPLVVVGVAGLFAAGRVAVPLPSPQGAANLGGAVLVAIFALMGFETGAVMAGEVRNPRRDLAAGILGGLSGAAVLYALLMVACLRVVPDLAHSTRPLAAGAATLLGSRGAAAVSVTAILACAGTLAVVMMTMPRVLYALAVQDDLLPTLASVDPDRRTPVIAIISSAVLVWLLTVSGTFVYLATFSAMARVLMYGSTCAALLVLRRRDGAAPIPVRWGPLFAVASLLASIAAIAATTGTAVRDLTIAVALGWVVRAALRHRRPAVA